MAAPHSKAAAVSYGKLPRQPVGTVYPAARAARPAAI